MSSQRQFKFSGLIAPHNTLHHMTTQADPHHFRFSGMISHLVHGVVDNNSAPDEHQVAPKTVQITITNPPPQRVVGIPQYSPTVVGGTAGYNPATNCEGNFMSYKFQPHNNCYAYGCNIAPNTFPQPGRAHGNLITSATLNGPSIRAFAEADGLAFVGFAKENLGEFLTAKRAGGATGGHFVALMISPAGDANWPGDYHWARCDDMVNFSSWSQKDGGDQVTNFDFAGFPISDPAKANWTVNEGPIQPDKTQPDYNPNDLIVDYAFYCYMYVPDTGVNII